MKEENRQLIVAISREFGSGGKEIGMLLARHYGIPFYEKNILNEMDNTWHTDGEAMYVAENTPRWLLSSRTVRGLTNTNEEVLAALEFDFLRQQADEGNSFVVMGHCAEEVFKDNPNLYTFFISASEAFKIPRIMKEHGLTEAEAFKMMKRHNKKRKSYHNYYCNHAWGDSRYYEMCLRSDTLGCQKSAQLLIDYIEIRKEARCHEKELMDQSMLEALED